MHPNELLASMYYGKHKICNLLCVVLDPETRARCHENEDRFETATFKTHCTHHEAKSNKYTVDNNGV